MSEDYILDQTFFTDGKHSHPADLPFDAYIRAISLFGGEDGVLSHSTTRARSFAQWMGAHPDRLAVYLDGAMAWASKTRSRAISTAPFSFSLPSSPNA